jgi:hypothetical protein
MNSLSELVLLSAVGKLFIYLWMEFPLYGWINNKFVRGLHECDLCSGVWVYSFLFILFRVDLLNMLGIPKTHFIIAGILTGGAISFFVHLLSIGFKDKFMSIIIE